MNNDIYPSRDDAQPHIFEHGRCVLCQAPLVRYQRRKLTRQEQLEGLADSGCDTWEEYRGER